MSGTVLLVRDGHAAWDAEGPYSISPLGWEQARLLGGTLAARGVAPATLLHGEPPCHAGTVESMAEAAGWSTEPVLDARWNCYDHREVLRDHMPTMVGGADPDPVQVQQWLQVAMLRWTSGEHDDYTEAFAAFARRTWDALGDAAERARSGGPVVVVTSGSAIAWVVVAMVGGWEPEVPAAELAGAWTRLHPVVVNTAVTKVAVGPAGVRLVSFNEHVHLEATAPVGG
ncbi:histidine phosphatase family protein [Nocardioides sp. ChNu-153]|uniref:histidine phosphatase family protein n=1 Tax=Nocardioides sp. ChNu-153 TaxID=2779364 RepID=UPI002656D7BA|nr:histidine phosphatase family protein [Nocardioides sp. ChNu-153]MDN7121099.1 histidine phosphatase family protein [Nocardioides sp. ChNu-153]